MVIIRISAICLKILFLVSIFFIFLGKVEALDYTVCSSGCNYTEIQAAVTACTDVDDRVVVAAGSYDETVTVDHPITITGGNNNPSTTKFILSGAPVSITGFDVDIIDVIGKEDGGRIQDAIDSVNSDGTVNVSNEGVDAQGTFTDELTIGKNLTLVGSTDDQGPLVTLRGGATDGTGVPITVTTGNVTISHFKIINSEVGLKVTGGNVTITGANFDGNIYGIQASVGANVVASNLYWNYSSGPKHTTTNPDGQGDEVGDRVAYRPFYTDEPGGILSTMNTSPDGILSLVGVGTFTIPNSETEESLSKITVAEQTTITVAVTGGNHTILLPIDTEITKTDGGNFDSSTITASADLSSSISGLGSNVELQKSIRWGVPDIGLSFNKTLTINVFVGSELNGQTLNILRSISGSSEWTTDGIVSPSTCTVSNGYCQFQATKASHYATTKNTSSSGNGLTSWSAPQCNKEKPEAPILYEPNHSLLPKSTKNGEVRLNWLKAKRADKYTVAYGLSSGKYIYGSPDVGNVDNYTVRFLTPGKKYYFVVRGVNDCMPGDWSHEWSALSNPFVSSELNNLTFETTLEDSPSPTPIIIKSEKPEAISNIDVNVTNETKLNFWQRIAKFFGSFLH